MSILIKGIEMPKPGHYEAVIMVLDESTAEIAISPVEDGIGYWKEYPLVPVPPHGRLGDMDAIARKIRRFGDYVAFTKDEIAGWFENGDFETIIPASEEGGDGDD